MSEGNNFGEAYNEAYEVKNSALKLKAERKEDKEPSRDDYERASQLLQKEREDQEMEDSRKIAEINKRLMPGKKDETLDEKKEQKKRIQEIERMNLGGIQKAEMVLVSLGAKKATNVMVYDWNDSPEDVKLNLEKNGLRVAEVSREKSNENLRAEFAVAQDKETAEKLANLNPEIDHVEFGRMMGFPESAIEAFGNSKTLAREKYPDMQGLIFKFILSEDHWQEEMEVMRNWTKLIEDNAPELYKELSVRGS